MDNLKGFTEAVEAIFPQTDVQLCIIHQIRNSFKYTAHKDRKQFTQDLKPIYQALDQFEEKWQHKYPLVIKSWRNNWHYLTRFFAYSKHLRRIMYTTNTIEGFNKQIRRVTKRKGSFPNDMSLMKLLFLAQQQITKEWTQKPPFWGQVKQELIIKFGEHVERYCFHACK